MEGKFPCRHSFGDIVKFKYRGHGIVEGMVVGVVIGGSKPENYYADYKINSLPGKEPFFYFKQVAEHHIIEE
jgi:hypothetical protein